MGKEENQRKVKVYRPRRKAVPESKVIEELHARYNTIDEAKLKDFADLPLSQHTLKGLRENNYVVLTDIQKQSIGLALRGHDILGAAKTGSGKTLAFIVPVLETLYCKQWTRLDGLGALIITPTRELAYQIYETLRKVGRYHDISAGLIIGGKDLKFEKKRMDQCNIVVCTPGRLLQHMDENPLFDCINMQILVLDEADRCLDMGFEQTMNSIIENLPPKRQTLLFSATQTKSVRDLARLSLKDPMYVSVHEHSRHTTPEGLQQSYIICPLEDKMSMLWSFIKNHLKQKSIIFFASCKQVKYVFEVFCRLRPGVSLLALYGTLHQLRRMNIYENFCKKEHAVLFATDIAARGLDFPAVNWVVQMDCPEDTNAYIHRAGRTARFQRGGESLLVLLPSEVEMVKKLEERKIPINLIKINPNKLHSPSRKLEALLARDVALKETAQRAFISYIKSISLMKDKEIFDVHALNTDAYAKSLGLAIPPRIRFLQRMQKIQTSSNTHKNENEEITNITSILSQRDRKNEDNSSDESDNDSEGREEGRPNKEKDSDVFNNDFSDDEDILKVKRKNIEIDDVPADVTELEDTDSNKKKIVTKAAVAKKILRKKIVPNRKTTFDEEGQEVIDAAKSKVSELARNYENEDASGIDIEVAKQVLREEDRFDKERFRQKIKEKHREQKRKLKAQKKKTDEEEEEDESEEASIADEQSDDEDSGPDTSWLPDPDKIYGKQEESNEGSDSHVSKTSDEHSDEDDGIHRLPKRKLVTIEEHKNTRKKRKLPTYDELDLKAHEDLALQLLHS